MKSEDRHPTTTRASSPGTTNPDIIRVALADDHKAVLIGLIAWLSDYQDFDIVGSTQDPDEMVDLCSRECPSVAVVDLDFQRKRLPRLAMRIKEVSPQTAVAIYSAFSEPDQVLEAFQSGADAYFSKDPDGLNLPDVVRDVAQGRIVLDPSIRSWVDKNAMPEQARAEIIKEIECWQRCTERESARSKLSILTVREREILAAKIEWGKDLAACASLGLRSDGDFKNRMAAIRKKLGMPTNELLRLFRLAESTDVESRHL